MKMKLKPQPKQKIKLKAKLFVAGVIVSAIALYFILSVPESPVPTIQTSSYNSARCLTFNGSTSGIDFSNNDLNLSAGNKMTITAWVKWSNKTTAGQWANIAALNNSSSSGDIGQFWLQHSSGNTNFEFAVQNISSTKNFVSSTTNPVVGTWYHVAGVYDGSFVYIYVNGIMEAKTALTGNINNYQGNFKLVFGKWANSGDSYRRFCGDIDEISLWNIALTQTQIRTAMCKKLAGNESGLLGYWRMDESSGTTVKDLTSNARNGSNTAAVIAVSGAPIGDASSYTYGGSSVSIKDPLYGDSLLVNGFSSTPVGIHVYRIDTIPNTNVPPSGYVNLDGVHYYGVFIVNSTGETYKILYCYKGHQGIVDASFLGLVTRSTNAILTWLDLSATLNTTTNTLSKSGQTGRNEYILATKNNINPLPVALINFNVIPEKDRVNIKWTTASEKNNDFFTIERSEDGNIFEQIDRIYGAGNSSSTLNYSFNDNNPLTGISYYRLKQTDYNGKSEYFKMMKVEFNVGHENTQVYYNSGIIVKLSGFNNQRMQLLVNNLSGQQIFSSVFMTDEINDSGPIKNTVLPPGIYIVSLITDQKRYSQKIMIN